MSENILNENILNDAINCTIQQKNAFCKFLTPNDSGETRGHQSGILISKSAGKLLFGSVDLAKTSILKRDIKICWQGSLTTDGCFTWYPSKNELRVTKFGRNFPFRGPKYTGSLFVLVQRDTDYYDAFIIDSDDEINQYLDTFGISPTETNRLIRTDNISTDTRESVEIQKVLEGFGTDFPESGTMSASARKIYAAATGRGDLIVKDPDKILVDWTDVEYKLFRVLEHARYGSVIAKGFQSVDDFILLANKVLNRRKSRAGKSLEHHLAAIFDGNNIKYTPQGITEGHKKPDFIFPSVEAYHNKLFPVENLCTLAAKTTCKDRWRQVLNEADRLRDDYKYLCTLQQGISVPQLEEMNAEKVRLVVPKIYIKAYPLSQQQNIWSVQKFVQYVRQMEARI